MDSRQTDVSAPATVSERAVRMPMALLAARSTRRLMLPFVALAVTIVFWEALVRIEGIPAYILPPPSDIWQSFWQDLRSPWMWWSLFVTAGETLLGFALGVLLGFVLGLLIAQFPVVEDAIYPIVVAFQAMPKVAVAPLLLIWLGFGIGSKVAIAALLAFFPLLVNTVLGLRSSDPQQEELMRSLSAKGWQIFTMVRFFNALPSIFAGIEVAMVMSVIGAIVGEFVGARVGLGYMIQQRNADTDVAGIFSVLFILGLFGAVMTYAVKIIARRVVFWQQM